MARVGRATWPPIDVEGKQSIEAVFETYEQAERAMREMKRSGLDMKGLRIVGDACGDEPRVGVQAAGRRATVKRVGGGKGSRRVSLIVQGRAVGDGACRRPADDGQPREVTSNGR